MKITVLMSVYNAEACIRRSIDSILEQTFTDFEFLIINDGSNDKTSQIVHSYNDERIRFVEHQENKGLSYRLREGAEQAGGDFIARLDAGDTAYPERLLKQIERFKKNPRLGLLGGVYETTDFRHKKVIKSEYFYDPEILRWNLLFRNIFCHSTVMMRRQSCLDAGNYDHNLKTCQDYDLWSRIAKDWDLEMLPNVLCGRVISEDSITIVHSVEQLECGRVISIDQLHAYTRGAIIKDACAEIYDLLERAYIPSYGKTRRILRDLARLIYISELNEKKIKTVCIKRLLDSMSPAMGIFDRIRVYRVACQYDFSGVLFAIVRKIIRKLLHYADPSLMLSKS